MYPNRCQNYDNGAKENIKLFLIIFNILANKNYVCARGRGMGCQPICSVCKMIDCFHHARPRAGAVQRFPFAHCSVIVCSLFYI